MELSLDLNKRYTFADYLTWWDDKRRELYDGLAHLMSHAANILYAKIIMKIIKRLIIFIDKYKGDCNLFAAPFSVCLPKNREKDDDLIYTVVQFDICLVCDPEKLDRHRCVGAPDMIVEALSPFTLRCNVNDKYRIYETAGVKEYRVVTPKDKNVIVFLLQKNGEYVEGIMHEKKSNIPIQNLQGLEIIAEESFK